MDTIKPEPEPGSSLLCVTSSSSFQAPPQSRAMVMTTMPPTLDYSHTHSTEKPLTVQTQCWAGRRGFKTPRGVQYVWGRKGNISAAENGSWWGGERKKGRRKWLNCQNFPSFSHDSSSFGWRHNYPPSSFSFECPKQESDFLISDKVYFCTA